MDCINIRRSVTALLGLAVAACLSSPTIGAARRSGKTASSQEAKHWAFEPVRRPATPVVRDTGWLRTPIDSFVLAQLEAKGIKPAPQADRRTLLRRAYLDVIGLPPTPEQQQAFLEDQSPDAYVKVVDALLSRPEYGERWARHWLDVVRYAESNGYERDGRKPHAWRYRDYVIDAFNKDKPYDRFVVEQLAGDEIEDANAESETATTFLRLGTWDDEPAEPMMDRYDQLDDVLGTTATAFLGLTLRCARCHDHKFEPFSQKDYYSMLSVFEPLKRPQNGRQDLDRFVGTQRELAAHQSAVAKNTTEVAAIQKRLDELKRSVGVRLLAAASPTISPTIAKVIKAKDSQRVVATNATVVSPDAAAALQTAVGKRTSKQKQLALKAEKAFEKEIEQAATKEEKATFGLLEKQIARIKASRFAEPPRAYIWYEDGPKAPITRVFRRGDPTRPLGSVTPQIPVVLVSQQPAPPLPTSKSTGRRLWLTRWMTQLQNPLLSRVMVNRIWQHQFGEGLVSSSNDFGVMGKPPSNPALLDWLAFELMSNGWRMKALQRMILLSNSYQMSSTGDRKGGKLDPECVLIRNWRQRRLEAEALRDSMLLVSGHLNSQVGGESVYPTLPRAVLEGQSRPGDGWGKSNEHEASRRSIYIFSKRSLGVPELELLDTPDTTSSCERRETSTTGPQALTFLNGEFAQRQAHNFAERLMRETGTDSKLQIRKAFEIALCRLPSDDEVQKSLAFLVRQQAQIEADAQQTRKQIEIARVQALEAFCLVLLNTNEFAYLN